MQATPNLFSLAPCGADQPPSPASAFATAQRPFLEATLPALLELAEQPDQVPSALAVLNHSYPSPLAELARQRLRQDPAIAALVAERYWGHWPSIGQLQALPAGSLGEAFGAFLL